MKLIIATNRAPYDVKKIDNEFVLERTAGGLVTALDPVMKEKGGTWVCGGEKLIEDFDVKPPYPIRQVKLTKKEVKHYYEGFCNTQIWPVFHYFPTRYKLHTKDWDVYKSVNMKFAQKIADILESDDVIWIHDYQLMLVPQMLREMGIENKIGFFLHIPFPNVEIYRIFPKRMEILESLLCCDLIGFHTPSYAKHFVGCAKYFLGEDIEVSKNFIKYGEYSSKIISLPISIDFSFIDRKARQKAVRDKLNELEEVFCDQIVGLGVDRLDYSKGIVEKLEGLELFFENHPEYIKKLSFIQIAVPTRTNVAEYAKLKRVTDEMVGRINGKFSVDGWTPIHYIYSSVPFEDLIAYYRLADFIVVSALRDGLNLVAKEYVASKIDNGGYLLLSEFTGAAEELPYRCPINPYDPISIAKAIYASIDNNKAVKREEMKELRSYVRKNDIFKWLDSFLDELRGDIQ